MAQDSTVARLAYLAGVTAALILGGCSDRGDDGVTERSWDYLGTVAEVTRGQGFAMTEDMFSQGGGEHPFTIGPMEMTMTDGTVLHVPAATPGGNYCLLFLSDEDRLGATGHPPPEGVSDAAVKESLNLSDTCVVIAEIGERETVERFEVLPTEVDGRAVVGSLVERRGDRYLTGSGYVFEVSPDVAASCGTTRGLDELLASDLADEARVDVDSDLIELVHCLSRE
jgi:hypothetical protein